MVEIIALGDFEEWFDALEESAMEHVTRAVDVLEILGLGLGHPQSSAINGASFGLRELRIQSNGRPLRVFYAFDPARQAVLILGGDKTGDKKFYRNKIARCEELWREHLSEFEA
jgi:hypothetical protein